MRSATYLSAMAAMMASGAVAKSELTWSHVMFGDIPVMLEGRVDPIVNPGVPSMHVHSVSGPNNFNMNSTGESLVKAKCTSADVKGDMSAYWMPKVYFHDEKAGHYEPVDVFYMKAYYHFRPTDDKIKAFPLGLQVKSEHFILKSLQNSLFGEISLTCFLFSDGFWRRFAARGTQEQGQGWLVCRKRRGAPACFVQLPPLAVIHSRLSVCLASGLRWKQERLHWSGPKQP